MTNTTWAPPTGPPGYPEDDFFGPDAEPERVIVIYHNPLLTPVLLGGLCWMVIFAIIGLVSWKAVALSALAMFVLRFIIRVVIGVALTLKYHRRS